MRIGLYARRALMIFLLLYAGMCAYLFMFQRDIIYKPSHRYVSPSPSLLPDMNEVKITTPDHINLYSWYQKASKVGYPTVLFLHGNRGGLIERAETYRDIVMQGYGLLALEYRGYSGNNGSPTEEGLYIDARSAMTFLKSHSVMPENVIVLGHSLGSGVAVQLATEFHLRALVLLAPYTSIGEIGAKRYWYAPVSLMLKDKFDSLGKADRVLSRVFIFHGKQDETIPFEYSQRLYAAMPTPKKLILFKHSTHNDLPIKRVLQVIAGE